MQQLSGTSRVAMAFSRFALMCGPGLICKESTDVTHEAKSPIMLCVPLWRLSKDNTAVFERCRCACDFWMKRVQMRGMLHGVWQSEELRPFEGRRQGCLLVLWEDNSTQKMALFYPRLSLIDIVLNILKLPSETCAPMRRAIGSHFEMHIEHKHFLWQNCEETICELRKGRDTASVQHLFCWSGHD